MTFKEAKKILEKEGFYVEKATRPCAISESFFEYEDPTICEAMQVVNSAGYFVCMEISCFDERKARLKKELEEHSNAPVSGKEKAKEGNPALEEAASQFNDALLDEQSKKIGEQNKEITRLLSLVEKKENSISRLYYEKSVLEKENEELKKGELPARYFDKALVDEQEEKIKKLEHEKLDILEMVSSCKQTIAEQGKKNKRLGKEISRLNGIIHDKNEEIKRKTKGCCELVAENVDLKEDLRNTESLLHDTREANSRNLDMCFKNEDLIDELKKKLAEKTKLAKKYAKELSDSSLGLCKLEKQLKDANKLVKTVRKYSKEYCEYGIEAVKMIRKMAKVIVNKGPVSSKDFKEYRRLANGYSFNPQLPDFSEEEEKKLTAKMVDINAKCMRAARESINDVFESYAAKYAKSTLDELKDKAYESFNAKAHKLGLVGSKDGKGIPDQMIRVDIAEEGGDQSVTIVQCDNGIILSKEEAEIIERCTKNGTELHYSKKDGLTYTNMFGEEMPIRCLRGMFHVFTDEEIENMKK